jgi:uncharacterized paraquat-inducible protein A
MTQYTPQYEKNLKRRRALRAEGLCIECRQINTNTTHWRCRRCRIKESLKQIERYELRGRKRTTESAA